MQIRFLLGPAGSGKTYRCLAEIREALRKEPEGPPLILLAPKQATFQLERQLLSDPELEGYTRLRILSFERLAEFVFTDLGITPPDLLSDVGRLMVFRALLAQKHKDLKLFHATALLPGFARQVSQQIREFQRHGLTPAGVACLAGQGGLRPELQSKLQDLALLFEAYFSWNSEHQLRDLYCLPDLAAEVLNKTPANPKDNSSRSQACELGGLWLDGFAEMTGQELNLLAAILPRCEQATLAFCLDAAPAKAGRPESWLSPWSTLRATFEECRERLMTVPGATCSVEKLPRDRKRSRFSASPVLAHLEKYWGDVTPFKNLDGPATEDSLQIVACPNPEGESTHAAREILRFVRKGGRYREAAVIVRNLETFQEPVARALRQFQIPFFVDQRQPAAHHPLAELTRCALRTVLFDWQHEDWFGALKTGLLPADEAELDWLENEALARGWKGQAWQAPLRIEGNPDLEKRLETLRKKVVGPLARFQNRIAGHSARPNGPQLAECIHGLWADLDIESQLERSDSVDATVWD
ncbi:MAG TPA: hypothetical protein VFD66_08980, partial [Verrucomicrobiae bacterium]|nr:hypothetical protein [Verrucomicrobiae bacterium]